MMRASFLSFAFAALLALTAAPAIAGAVQAPLGDMSLGSPKAKIQVTEYASMSCPHCGRFSRDVFPAFKKKYIDTGKVHFTLKEFLTPPEQVAMAGFIIARCGGTDKYFPLVEGIFASQPEWTQGDIFPVFLKVAEANGLTEAQVRACMADTDAIKALTDRVQVAMEKDGVNSTPTFVINGKKVAEGEVTLADLDKFIAAAKSDAGPAAKAKSAAHRKAKKD